MGEGTGGDVGRIRLVFRQLSPTGNEDSHLAAEASLAAHAQGKL